MHHRSIVRGIALFAGVILLTPLVGLAGESWPQYKFDARHSGDAPERTVKTPLGVVGTVALTDAVFTAPVVADGEVYVLDGAGVLTCVDAATLAAEWRFESRGGAANTANVSSPAIAGKFIHFGTTAGSYYVLDRKSGALVREIRCGEPIFSSPVVVEDRIYFATLGSRLHALTPAGKTRWVWDFVKEEWGFTGDRWSGAAWAQHKKSRVSPNDQFLCARDVAAHGNTVVLPAGGWVVWLEDLGDRAERRAIHATPRTPTPTLGLTIGEDGAVYRQWHWLDNRGRVDVLRRKGAEVERTGVPGTATTIAGGLLSFSAVSVRGGDVYRTRIEEDYGLCLHASGAEKPRSLGTFPAVAPPVLAGDKVIHGGLDGRLYVAPISGSGPVWSFRTAFDKVISAPVAVADGRVYFGCEDGYLYVLGPDGKAPLPTKDLGLATIRSPLTGKRRGSEFDRFTSFGDWANTNSDDRQGIEPPFRLRWIRRYEGSGKHFSTFGGGRMYTHTAEGQIFAVEAETGRQLWRVYYPGVYMCYTSPLYFDGKLLVPQAGLKICRLRCLDAATGKLLWEAPFGGSPSWNRQLPPVVHNGLAIYMFGTGKYGPDVPKSERLEWLFEHQNNPRFPASHKPILRAYDLATGATRWERDFSEYGAGGDEAGVALMDGVLYYTCFFGHQALRRGERGPVGLTAALDPKTGKTRWLTTDYWMNGGCTISAADGRLYLGGYNPVGGTDGRYVWCLDASDGSLVWRSEPLLGAIQVVTVGPRFLFAHAQYQNGYLLDKATGKVIQKLTQGYKCTRFTLSEPYMVGPNLDLIDVSKATAPRLVSTGPRIDPSECVGMVASNGRLFYTAQGSGLQVGVVAGDEASTLRAPWEAE